MCPSLSDFFRSSMRLLFISPKEEGWNFLSLKKSDGVDHPDDAHHRVLKSKWGIKESFFFWGSEQNLETSKRENEQNSFFGFRKKGRHEKHNNSFKSLCFSCDVSVEDFFVVGGEGECQREGGRERERGDFGTKAKNPLKYFLPSISFHIIERNLHRDMKKKESGDVQFPKSDDWLRGTWLTQ